MNEMIILSLESDKKRGEDCSDLNSDTCFAQLCEDRDRREIKTYNFDAAVSNSTSSDPLLPVVLGMFSF